jgi:hypothetical protein
VKGPAWLPSQALAVLLIFGISRALASSLPRHFNLPRFGSDSFSVGLLCSSTLINAFVVVRLMHEPSSDFVWTDPVFFAVGLGVWAACIGVIQAWVEGVFGRFVAWVMVVVACLGATVAIANASVEVDALVALGTLVFLSLFAIFTTVAFAVSGRLLPGVAIGAFLGSFLSMAAIG